MNHVAKQREGTGGQHLADFATLPSAVVKVVRDWRNRQHAFVVTAEKVFSTKQKAKTLTASSTILRKHVGNGATLASSKKPRCMTFTSEGANARILDSNRRHFTQGAPRRVSADRWWFKVKPRREQWQSRNSITKKQVNRGLERIHGDATVKNDAGSQKEQDLTELQKESEEPKLQPSMWQSCRIIANTYPLVLVRHEASVSTFVTTFLVAEYIKGKMTRECNFGHFDFFDVKNN